MNVFAVYDPQSTITGADVVAGLTYLNSSVVNGKRVLLPSQVGEQRATRYHPDFDGAFDHIPSTSRLSSSYGDLRVASELEEC